MTATAARPINLTGYAAAYRAAFPTREIALSALDRAIADACQDHETTDADQLRAMRALVAARD